MNVQVPLHSHAQCGRAEPRRLVALESETCHLERSSVILFLQGFCRSILFHSHFKFTIFTICQPDFQTLNVIFTCTDRTPHALRLRPYSCMDYHSTMHMYTSLCLVSRKIGDFENYLFLVCERFSPVKYA